MLIDVYYMKLRCVTPTFGKGAIIMKNTIHIQKDVASLKSDNNMFTVSFVEMKINLIFHNNSY